MMKNIAARGYIRTLRGCVDLHETLLGIPANSSKAPD